MQFEDKVVVITGAGSGIGRATALSFAREEAAVVVVDANRPAGEETVRLILDEGGQALFVEADVSQAADAQRIAWEAVEAFGGIDVLINNAGIDARGTVVDFPEEEWDRILAVNLKGVYLCSKYCIPEIAKRGGGAVVNVASVLGLRGQAGAAAYAASKAGVIAMTRAMALDHGSQHIRVNCVCPGTTLTPMLRQTAERLADDPDAAIQRWGARNALGRVGRPDEVAELVFFLASDRASFMTGAPYLVDAGLSAAL